MDNNWKQVGKVKEPHGLKGELYILIFSGDVSWAPKLKQFQLGQTLYQVERVKPYKDGLIVKPREISDRNASEAVQGQSFSISASLFVSKKGETIYLSEILGFHVYDGNTDLGPIQKFSSNGPQDLLVLTYYGKEVEIPFVEAFIRKIDFENSKVLMELPVGLYDMSDEEND